MAESFILKGEIATLLEDNRTYHAILRTLTEYDAIGFNELFREAAELRKRLYPELGELSKNTYFTTIESLLEAAAVSRVKDLSHSQKWLYSLDPVLRTKLVEMYYGVESDGFYTNPEAKNDFFEGKDPPSTVGSLVKYTLASLLAAYAYGVEHPDLAAYRLSLTMESVEALGARFSEIGAGRREYVDAVNEVRNRLVAGGIIDG